MELSTDVDTRRPSYNSFPFPPHGMTLFPPHLKLLFWLPLREGFFIDPLPPPFFLISALGPSSLTFNTKHHSITSTSLMNLEIGIRISSNRTRRALHFFPDWKREQLSEHAIVSSFPCRCLIIGLGNPEDLPPCLIGAAIEFPLQGEKC